MNVLQIVPELNAGGVERTVLEVDDALNAAGHGSHVASRGGTLEGELSGTLHRLDMATKNPLRWIANARALRAIIREHKIDIVHARSRAPAFAARRAALKEGTAWITTYHGIYNASNAFKRDYNSVMASGDLVIANSHFTRAHILTQHGTEPARIRVVPRGVDMARLDPARITADAVAAQRRDWLGEASGPATVLLLPGRITEWKGQAVAIDALAKLVAREPALHLVLLGRVQGDGGYRARLDARIAALTDATGESFAARVHIHPHTDDMATAYAAADIVLSTSTDPEAFGRVAAEAQAMGVPVIATAHGGSLETVEDGVTGRLVPPGDAAALAVAIAEVLGWHAEDRYDGAHARARIKRLFSDTRLKSAILAIYAELLERKRDATA